MCPAACGIFLDQGPKQHWQAASQSLDHQEVWGHPFLMGTKVSFGLLDAPSEPAQKTWESDHWLFPLPRSQRGLFPEHRIYISGCVLDCYNDILCRERSMWIGKEAGCMGEEVSPRHPGMDKLIFLGREKRRQNVLGKRRWGKAVRNEQAE